MTHSIEKPRTAEVSPQVRGAVIALIVGGIAAILDSTMVTLAIHTLTVELHSTTDMIQWVTTGFLLAMALAIPFTGWMDRRWGGKRAWMVALLVFVIGSVLCAAAWDDVSLIAFRAVQGFGAGLIMPLMQTIVVGIAGGRPSSRLMASVTLPIALGPILGPVIGGVILHWLSWRWLFLVNVPLIAVGLVLAWRLLPDREPHLAPAPERIDWAGLCLLAPALVGVLWGLSELSEEGGIAHTRVLMPLAIGIVALVAFIAWALRPGRSRRPVVDIALLRLRSLGSASAVLFVSGAVMYAGMFLLPLYYQQSQGASVLSAGLLMIPQGVGALVSRVVVGRLVDRLGAAAVTAGSFVIVAVTTIPFAFAGPDSSQWWLGAVLFVRGLGVGAVLIPAMSVAYRDLGPDDVSQASMNTRIVQQVGASFGTAIVAVALQSYLVDVGTASAFQGAFWWLVGMTLIAIVPAALLPTDRLSHVGSSSSS